MGSSCSSSEHNNIKQQNGVTDHTFKPAPVQEDNITKTNSKSQSNGVKIEQALTEGKGQEKKISSMLVIEADSKERSRVRNVLKNENDAKNRLSNKTTYDGIII